MNILKFILIVTLFLVFSCTYENDVIIDSNINDYPEIQVQIKPYEDKVLTYSVPTGDDLNLRDICIIHTRGGKYLGKEFISDAQSQALQHFGNKTSNQNFKLLTITPMVGDTSFICANLGWSESQYDAILPAINSNLSYSDLHDMFDNMTLDYKSKTFLPISGVAVWVTKYVAYSTMKFALARVTVRFDPSLELTDFLKAPTTHIYFQFQNDQKTGCIFPYDYNMICDHHSYFESESHYTDGTKGTPLGDTVYIWESPARTGGSSLTWRYESEGYCYKFWSARNSVLLSIYDDLRPTYEKHLRCDLVKFVSLYEEWQGEQDPNVYYPISRGDSYSITIGNSKDIPHSQYLTSRLDELEDMEPNELSVGSLGYNSFNDAYYHPASLLLEPEGCLWMLGLYNNVGSAKITNGTYSIYTNYWGYYLYSDDMSINLGIIITTLTECEQFINKISIASSTETVAPTVDSDKVTSLYNYGMVAPDVILNFNSPADPNGTTTVIKIELGNLVLNIPIIRYPSLPATQTSLPLQLFSASRINLMSEINDCFAWGKTPTEWRDDVVASSNLTNETFYFNIKANNTGEERKIGSVVTYYNATRGSGHIDKCYLYVTQKAGSPS